MLKKVLCVVGGILGVVLGFLAIWKIVIPFIGNIFSWFMGGL